MKFGRYFFSDTFHSLQPVQACFVAAWHSKHARQCPNGETIKKDWGCLALVLLLFLLAWQCFLFSTFFITFLPFFLAFDIADVVIAGRQEMLEKAGGPQAMMKNGAKFLMAVAVSKVFEAETLEAPKAPNAPEAPEAVEASVNATLLLRVPVEDDTGGNAGALLAECAELRRAREGVEELNSQLQAKVAS